MCNLILHALASLFSKINSFQVRREGRRARGGCSKQDLEEGSLVGCLAAPAAFPVE